MGRRVIAQINYVGNVARRIRQSALMQMDQLPIGADAPESSGEGYGGTGPARRADREILVFVPGAAEIRPAARACEPIARQFNRIVLPLHGDAHQTRENRAIVFDSVV
ncbi:MAG: hypothetical protein ABSD59_20770 [Terracidiphilus sp.]